MNQLNPKQFKLVISLILIGIISRFLPHPPNMTAVAAVSLFAGAILNSRFVAFILPLVLMYLSDFVINNTISRIYFTNQEGLIFWSSYMTWVYLAFGITVLIGSYLLKNRSNIKIVGGAIAATLVFWLLSNFGSFLSPISGYPLSFEGAIACYTLAVPFLLNSLIGNLVFSFAIFGTYDLINERQAKAKELSF